MVGVEWCAAEFESEELGKHGRVLNLVRAKRGGEHLRLYDVDTEGPRGCPLLKRRLWYITLVMSDLNASASMGVSARGVVVESVW